MTGRILIDHSAQRQIQLIGALHVQLAVRIGKRLHLMETERFQVASGFRLIGGRDMGIIGRRDTDMGTFCQMCQNRHHLFLFRQAVVLQLYEKPLSKNVVKIIQHVCSLLLPLLPCQAPLLRLVDLLCEGPVALMRLFR